MYSSLTIDKVKKIILEANWLIYGNILYIWNDKYDDSIF